MAQVANGTSAYAARSIAQLGERIKSVTARAEAVARTFEDVQTPTAHAALSNSPLQVPYSKGKTSTTLSWCDKEKLYMGLAIAAVVIVGTIAIVFSIVALRKTGPPVSGQENRLTAAKVMQPESAQNADGSLHVQEAHGNVGDGNHLQQQLALGHEMPAPIASQTTSSLVPERAYDTLEMDTSNTDQRDNGERQVMFGENVEVAPAADVVTYAMDDQLSANDIQLPMDLEPNLTYKGQQPSKDDYEHVPVSHGEGMNYEFQSSATGGPLSDDELHHSNSRSVPTQPPSQHSTTASERLDSKETSDDTFLNNARIPIS